MTLWSVKPLSNHWVQDALLKNCPKDCSCSVSISQQRFLGYSMQIKIVDNIGYIQKGAIGIGFGAWSRAWEIRQMFTLDDYPVSLPLEEWLALTTAPIEVTLVKFPLKP